MSNKLNSNQKMIGIAEKQRLERYADDRSGGRIGRLTILRQKRHGWRAGLASTSVEDEELKSIKRMLSNHTRRENQNSG